MLSVGKFPLYHSAAPNSVAVTVDCKWILMGNVPKVTNVSNKQKQAYS